MHVLIFSFRQEAGGWWTVMFCLSWKRTKSLHMIAAITSTDLVEGMLSTLWKPPFDFLSEHRTLRLGLWLNRQFYSGDELSCLSPNAASVMCSVCTLKRLH